MNGISGENAAAYCRGLRPDRRGKVEAVKLVSSTSLRGIPKHSKIFQRNVETLRRVPLKSLGWMPKSLKILRSRPQTGDRKKLEKLEQQFGVVAEQVCRLWEVWVPGGGGWLKSRCFAERANRPQGPQSKQAKTNRRDQDTFFEKDV